MPTIFSKLFSQRDITLENHRAAELALGKNRQSYQNLRYIVQTCKEIEREQGHWENISEKFNNANPEEAIDTLEILNKTPWTPGMNHPRRI